MNTDPKNQVGQTPNELAKVLRVSPDRIRSWITSGKLKALNLAPTRAGRPRFVILPHHLQEFERRHQAASSQPKPSQRPASLKGQSTITRTFQKKHEHLHTKEGKGGWRMSGIITLEKLEALGWNAQDVATHCPGAVERVGLAGEQCWDSADFAAPLSDGEEAPE